MKNSYKDLYAKYRELKTRLNAAPLNTRRWRRIARKLSKARAKLTTLRSEIEKVGEKEIETT